ncbi:MAG: hypothetical protein QOJ95_1648 [Mycobacterium sp.]|jgi:hypothetical protein|nr:hypothetical protein [Mycobacterium sp.]MDT5177450.1 hypothetical protein [Mycobacterium sp.]
MWVKKTVVAAALAAAVAGAVPGVASADPTTPAPTPSPAPAGAPTGPKTSITADGTYAVGTDIAPGVYSSAGPVGDGTCFWKRAGNPDGATIDNALTKKPQTVQIDATDKSFKTNGCQPWQLTDGAAPPAPGIAPALAGLQLGAMMAQLNANAAASGQTNPP